ncbi:uncharacterized protein LOC8037716, partial [Ixodes scapularis]|uniref:uncharacterized protein LOC8037716 n=1 Tax=Ixodes scapularis TaxID=6945 RepID=UPI001C390BFA
ELSPADAVVLRLKAYDDGVAKVTLNDRILSFRQEADLEIDKCQYFSIVGDVFVASVSIFKPEWPDHMHVTLGNQIAAGYHFTVEGTVSPTADKLVISVLRSPDVHDDVLVGIRCQFEGEKQMVRRTKQEGVWLEEQLETQFPFALGEPFTMDVAVLEKEFHMAVNGQTLPPYNHKVFYGQGQFICIDKNVTVKNIRVCSISHPKHWTSKPPNVKQASLIFHRSDAPASRQIMLDVGQCYYIQGTPPLHSKTFKITFAKGDTENAEALLVLQPVLAENRVYVYDGSPEQKGNGLHADIRIGRLFSCRIDVGADSYKVWVNTLVSDDNVDPYEVKHRLPITEALFLNVFGHIKNVSALKAVEEVA